MEDLPPGTLRYRNIGPFLLYVKKESYLMLRQNKSVSSQWALCHALFSYVNIQHLAVITTHRAPLLLLSLCLSDTVSASLLPLTTLGDNTAHSSVIDWLKPLPANYNRCVERTHIPGRFSHSEWTLRGQITLASRWEFKSISFSFVSVWSNLDIKPTQREINQYLQGALQNKKDKKSLSRIKEIMHRESYALSVHKFNSIRTTRHIENIYRTQLSMKMDC